jgi:L-amino acid N-acyltransferase YncA
LRVLVLEETEGRDEEAEALSNDLRTFYQMKIRNAIFNDIPRLAEIHVRAWQAAYAEILPADYLSSLSIEKATLKWSNWIKNPKPGQFHLVAEKEGHRVIGFASGGPEKTRSPRNWGELSAIYVQSGYQKQGFGTALFLSVVESFTHQGFKGMISWMLVENPAGGFYQKLGGKQKGSKEEIIGGMENKMIAYQWAFSKKGLILP